VSYALASLKQVEALAAEIGLSDRLHLWPDKVLGSAETLASMSGTDAKTYRAWLDRWWSRVSEWPKDNTKKPLFHAAKCTTEGSEMKNVTDPQPKSRNSPPCDNRSADFQQYSTGNMLLPEDRNEAFEQFRREDKSDAEIEGHSLLMKYRRMRRAKEAFYKRPPELEKMTQREFIETHFIGGRDVFRRYVTASKLINTLIELQLPIIENEYQSRPLWRILRGKDPKQQRQIVLELTKKNNGHYPPANEICPKPENPAASKSKTKRLDSVAHLEALIKLAEINPKDIRKLQQILAQLKAPKTVTKHGEKTPAANEESKQSEMFTLTA
jgi:hypothetical protein